MNGESADPLFWPLGVYIAVVVGIVGFMLAASFVLGQKNRNREKAQPYESGIASTGGARLRLSADFYLFAMFFVIFDLESVFVYTWAINVRELGWVVYGQISLFVGAVAAALIYLWRIGALDTRR